MTDEVRASMRGSAAKRAVTLRHGIDVEGTAAALSDRDAVRTELGIGPEEFVIGTVANFRPQKDYPNLLSAAKLLVEGGTEVRIVAVGQGPQEAEIRALHQRLGLGDRVLFTGFRDDAVRVMAACDVFTLASRWEGLPVAVMEALALGLPDRHDSGRRHGGGVHRWCRRAARASERRRGAGGGVGAAGR